MDALAFDGYASYSDASTPRTPSPAALVHFPPDFHGAKHDADHHPVRELFAADDAQDTHFWPFTNNGSRGSLLQELYEPDEYQQDAWAQQQQQQQQYQQRPAAEFPTMRRATFPYVRHDREDGMQMQQYPPFMPQQQQYQYNDSMGAHQDAFISSSPHSQYTDFEPEIKLEDGAAPLMVPSQPGVFYRSAASASPHMHPHLSPSHAHLSHPSHLSSHHAHQMYMSPHAGLPVQHTDDAASKETQYLRRRCFNCHTTEPPSWRRSTLNPGKIVCNKCGLYERTHLRPRPLRFDELRAGNKARKQGKAAAAAAAAASAANPSLGGSVSPKQKPVKKEFAPVGLARRSSVSSSASSVHSGSGASDWDDNVSLYSSGSAPPTSFSSPASHTHSLAPSPPGDGGIRLPNNPLSDIASLQHQQQMLQQHQQQQQMQQQHMQTGSPQSQHPTPRKAHTAPGYFSPPSVHASPAQGAPAALLLHEDNAAIAAGSSASPEAAS